ncbi:MAG: nucleotidyl transferase AbiEii/AbiGii toxin family protein [Spirochaetia bacterium]
MRDYLRQIVAERTGALQKICAAREYLQARMLQMLQEMGAFRHWAFVGGMALRFLYSIPRFSEDLDFSHVRTAPSLDFRNAVIRIKAGFEAEAYSVGLTVKADRTVASAFVKFPGLLYELDLSPHPSQVLSIKLEIDTNPPAGAVLDKTLVRRLGMTLNLTHYDKGSLLAGKLHALLTRSYTKGRDLFDLIWYLADHSWPAPNLDLLAAALAQTGWTGPVPTADTWRRLIAERLASVNWRAAQADVEPFLEREADRGLVVRENVMALLMPKQEA